MGQEQSQESDLRAYETQFPKHAPPAHDHSKLTQETLESTSTVTSLTQSQQSKKEVDTDRMDVPFVWRHGGQKVVVKGSWDKWETEIELAKLGGQEFYRIVVSVNWRQQKLKRGVHTFKFIVDGEWRYAPEQKSKADEWGNINNVIDTEEYRAQFEKVAVCFTHRGSSRSYSQNLPNPADFCSEAKTVKPHQLRHFLTYEPPDAKYYKNLEYSPELPKKRWPGDTLLAPPHSMVFHASSARRENVGGNVVQTTCFSSPVKHKYVTTVYYEYENK